MDVAAPQRASAGADPGTGEAGANETWWRLLLDGTPTADPAASLYLPLLAPPRAADGCFVLGRIAQSLDGRIATTGGDSFWITGDADVLHTHRLRALSDAIVVGAGTVRSDDPLLTTRHCEGPSPVRVVIDANRRLKPDFRVFRTATRTLLLCASDQARGARCGLAEVVGVPRSDTGLDPAAIVGALAARGLRRIFVEGGGVTVSRFLAAGALDRLHVTVAPLLLGAGVPAFTLPCPGRPDRGMRVQCTTHALGADMLVDIVVDRTRPPMC